MDVVKCDDCGRERTADDRDYSPVQLLMPGQVVGWSSGLIDELCGSCLRAMFEQANGQSTR